MASKDNLSGSASSTGKKKVKRPSAIEVWKYVIRSAWTKDLSDEGPARNYNLYASSNAIYSNASNVLYMYTLDQYPESIPIDLHKKVREYAEGSVRVSFLTPLEPTTVQWSSARMRSRLRTWQRSKEDSKEVDEYNIREEMSRVDSNRRRQETLVYLAEAEQKRKRKLFIQRTLMLVSGTRGQVFDDSVAKMVDYLKGLGIVATRVDTEIEEYLRAFSPFSMEMTDKIRKNLSNTTITDEIAARLSSYDQGKIGTGRVYTGTDLISGYHVFKEFKRDSTDSENILIAAEAGGGKSFFAKTLVIQLLGDYRMNGTIMDIEGDEYIPILNFVGQHNEVALLNMAEGQGQYFDPMEIYLTGDPDLDNEMYNLSVSCAKSVLKAISGTSKGHEDWIDTLLDIILSETYKKYGVSPLKPETWPNSRKITIHDTYTTITDLRSKVKNGKLTGSLHDTLDDPDASAAMNLLYARMSNYLAPDGARAGIFREKINMESIAHSKLVICSFGMRGKDYSSIDKTQMTLSQIYAARISHLRSLMSKKAGKYNFKVWEEFQRFSQFPGSESTVNTALTGGRKLGDVNIINTNRLDQLLGGKDRYGIMQNLTSWAVGAVGSASSREQFCEELSVTDLLPELDRIPQPRDISNSSSISRDDSDEETDTGTNIQNRSKYDKGFLIKLDRGDPALIKVMLPDSISKSDLMRTGVKVSTNVKTNITRKVDW